MEDLAFSIDQRNATDWASASELAAPGISKISCPTRYNTADNM
jgi:hypothetical protein